MSNMLAGAKQSTLPVLILSMNKTGVTPDVNALATIMILIIVAAMILIILFKGPSQKGKIRRFQLMKKRLLATVLAGAMVLSMAACGSSNANKTESAAASETANASTEAGAESSETQAAAQDGDASSELNIYMWQQYISDDLIKNFETENNCKVNLSYMSDNADAINKLTAGGGDEYDLIMTCDAYMKSLIAGGYVEELNLDNIPNSSNINDTYWVSKGYCVPYLMNYIYVVYDSETCPVEIHSYNDLLQSGLKISTIDGARNLFPIALVALGYDPNSTK